MFNHNKKKKFYRRNIKIKQDKTNNKMLAK